jgi:hypothetical protein
LGDVFPVRCPGLRYNGLSGRKEKRAGFGSETERLEYLFGLYNEYTSPLIGAEAKKKGRKKG